MKKIILVILMLMTYEHHTSANEALFTSNQQPKLTRAPYVQLATPHSITIVWRTEGLFDFTVRSGPSPQALNNLTAKHQLTIRASIDQAADFNGPSLHSAPSNTFQYEAHITGLDPATQYFYGIYQGNQLVRGSRDQTFFKTPALKKDRTPLRVVTFGCSGSGRKRQKDVWNTLITYTANQPPDLFIHTGDIAYDDGTDEEFQTKFFDIYKNELSHLVCWPAYGNHEGQTSDSLTGEGPYFDAYVLPTRAEAGGVASHTEAYYAFDWGPVHFISLDSYEQDASPTGAMAQWLAQDLEETQAAWIIAFWHHPPYSLGTHDSNREEKLTIMRENFMPILERGGVDICLSSHSHVYERSMLIQGAHQTPTLAHQVILDDSDGDPDGFGAYRKSAGKHADGGVICAVVGTGGASLRKKGNMAIMATSHTQPGFLLLDIEDDELTGTFVTTNGAIADRFSLIKRGTVKPKTLTHPWQPIAPKILPSIPWFISSTTISLERVTGAAEEIIYYTTDGRMPTQSSTVYTEPIIITQDTQITARSYLKERNRWLPSSTKRFSIYHQPFYPGTAGPKSKTIMLAQGLDYRFYEGSWKAIPPFEKLLPTHTGTTERIHLKEKTLEDNFGMTFNGYLKIPTAGIYTFYLESDDGSTLSLHEEKLINHDGLHGLTEKVGYTGLQAGLHPFEIRYFEKGGSEALHLYYEGPGIPRQEVPASALWRREVIAKHSHGAKSLAPSTP